MKLNHPGCSRPCSCQSCGISIPCYSINYLIETKLIKKHALTCVSLLRTVQNYKTLCAKYTYLHFFCNVYTYIHCCTGCIYVYMEMDCGSWKEGATNQWKSRAANACKHPCFFSPTAVRMPLWIWVDLNSIVMNSSIDLGHHYHPSLCSCSFIVICYQGRAASTKRYNPSTFIAAGMVHTSQQFIHPLRFLPLIFLLHCYTFL